MKWQPIDTAPTDGTSVDLWVVAMDTQFRAPNFKFCNGQWVGRTSDEPLDCHYMNDGIKPTHWMPIPQSPYNAKLTAPEHVAWCRYVTATERPTRIVLCDSDAPGAFPVYRHQQTEGA